MRCESIQEQLTLHASGDLEPAEARPVEEHLSACDACRQELRELRATVRALDAAAVHPAEARVDWERFAAETAGMAAGRVVPLRRRLLRPAALARAAALVLALGAGWMALRNLTPTNHLPVGGDAVEPRGGVSAPQTTSVISEEFQRRVEVNLARNDARQYLEESREVLLAVLEAPVRCQKDEIDISAERQKSMELLRRKRLLHDDLDRPELARAAELCDKLEGLLTEISTLRNCADPETIRALRDAVRRNQLLVKIGVAEKELGGQRA